MIQFNITILEHIVINLEDSTLRNLDSPSCCTFLTYPSQEKPAKHRCTVSGLFVQLSADLAWQTTFLFCSP